MRKFYLVVLVLVLVLLLAVPLVKAGDDIVYLYLPVLFR